MLSAFEKTFGLDAEKGYFPHLLMKQLGEELPVDPTHEQIMSALHNYSGFFPSKEMYDVERFKASTFVDTENSVQRFHEWHDEEAKKYPGRSWNLWDQLKSYCQQDAEVLRQRCMKYRNKFLGDPSESLSKSKEHSFPLIILNI